MNDKDKDLLLRDLCGRLSYGVKVEAKGLLKTIADDYDNRGIINAHVLNGLNLRDCFKTYSIDCMEKVPLFNRKGVCNIKPYLFPLSSMTEEQFNSLKSYVDLKYEHNALELVEWDDNYKTLEFWLEEIPSYHLIKVFEWLNKNYFDYRELIPKGLAINCTNLNIY